MTASTKDHAVLVTGANGLVGYRLVEKLKALGRPIVAVDRTIADVEKLDVPAHAVEIGDTHKLYAVIDQHNVSAIVHCGGVSGPMLGRDNPARLLLTNVGGTIDIAECSRFIKARRGSARLVFCSSVGAYGDHPNDGIKETVPLLADGIYGASKAAAEAVLRAYAAEQGVDAICLRISWVYGPRRTTDCVIRTMIEDALAARQTRLPFGRDLRRQFVHVDDVADALILALDVSRPHQFAYNITAGQAPTLLDVAEIVRQLIPGADIDLAPGPDPQDSLLGLLDIAAAERDLGYRPKMEIRKGISQYRQWLEQSSSR